MSQTLIEKVQAALESETGIKRGCIGLQEMIWNATHSNNAKTKVHVFQWATHPGQAVAQAGLAIVTDRRGSKSFHGTADKLEAVAVQITIGISETHKAALVAMLPDQMRAEGCNLPPSLHL